MRMVAIWKKIKCSNFKKPIYGLLQAARQWYKRFEEALKDIGFKHNLNDPGKFEVNEMEKEDRIH